MNQGSGLDPLSLLALHVHAQPGVYALLLGSGVSRGADMPTGWGVMQELVARVATANAPADPTAGEKARSDPKQWWSEHRPGQELNYSDLLQALGPSPATRRDLLAGFFEPTQEDLADGRKAPSAAHRAIAMLVRRGYIRVILTTNFDRLTEQALADVGVHAQIISRAELVAGMTPLQHADVTVIKLHGDYVEQDIRNTVSELADYPQPWLELLQRVLREYGLLISGWSGESDHALVAALKQDPYRRYPLYWDGRSSKGRVAQDVLAQHTGQEVPAASADVLFTGLLEQVDALERLSEPPVSTAVAVARLKRYLLEPTRRVDLHDLIRSGTERAVQTINAQPWSQQSLDPAGMQQIIEDLTAGSDSLLRLVAAGVYDDHAGLHDDLWVEAVQRLLTAGRHRTGPQAVAELVNLRHLPALLLMRTAGLIAVHTGREDTLLNLVRRPRWRDPAQPAVLLRAFEGLHDLRVFNIDSIRSLPRWREQEQGSNGELDYPISALLRADLRELVREQIPEAEDYVTASDGYEYRLALLQQLRQPAGADLPPAAGLFIAEPRWTARTEGRPIAEVNFRTATTPPDASRAGAWSDLLDVAGGSLFESTLSELRQYLRRVRELPHR